MILRTDSHSAGGGLPPATSYSRASVFLLAIFAASIAVPFASQVSAEGPVTPHITASQLALRVVQNELAAQDHDKSLWKYREISQEDGKVQAFEIIETSDGEVRRLLEVNGKPLNPKARQEEDRRIANLLSDPHEFREKQKSAAQDADQARQLLQLLPKAFLYEYAGTQGGFTRLKFRPNPDFHATSRESEVFHHMEGTMLVEPRHDRLAELDGRLTSEVKFWDGILGHLDKGGTFTVKQKDVGGGHWEMIVLDVQMNGKALFFKTIAVREKVVDSDFHALPEQTSLKQARELLAVNTSSR